MSNIYKNVIELIGKTPLVEVENVEKTSVILLVDKEEVGSIGATGMHSRFFENSLAEVMDRMG